MHYIVYRITNTINNKIYIGKHQTSNVDDGYFGSGKLLKNAIKKYGLENFTKEILHVFDNEEDMNSKEAELVTEEFCSSNNTYNICPGGKGGWGYVNQNNLGGTLGISPNEETRKLKSKIQKELWNNLSSEEKDKWRKSVSEGMMGNKWRLGIKHTDETKRLMSEKAKERTGDKNSQFGTMWITNGNENRKIKKIDIIPNGWYKGRVIKKR